MTEEKISYKLIYLMLSMFIMGVSLEYAYMDKIMQYESVAYFSYTCDLKLGAGEWQTQRVSYNTWVCIPKTAQQPIPQILNVSEDMYACLKEGKCDINELPKNYTLDLTNKSLTITSRINATS